MRIQIRIARWPWPWVVFPSATDRRPWAPGPALAPADVWAALLGDAMVAAGRYLCPLIGSMEWVT
jgi:hypothetical protein